MGYDLSPLKPIFALLFYRYRLRSKVDIENVAEDFSCWQRFGKNLSRKASSAEEPEAASVGWGAGVDPAAMSSSRGEDTGWQWFQDPRLECLGFRGIFPSNETRKFPSRSQWSYEFLVPQVKVIVH